jgi:predicted Zn-ribbon and HTH transcriptional regulator
MEHEFERQLRALAIERRPEACLGCGFEHGCSVHGCAVIHAAVNRLAAYEETRLEPEDMKKAFNEDATLKLAGQILGMTPGRLRELAQADREGRVKIDPKALKCPKCGKMRLFPRIDWQYYYCYSCKTQFPREAAEAALEERECTK